ncbi:hypothetical protein EB796_013909 [Bugula neritina]|uniref:Retrotransposon gag domain-containing protein n=1 Tax=Bugula neritina TaxID=10212 RepID=A0A7J7JQ29_BUGNE|nr:hypothetical protein EB796_013909 [Bugula neritina]
MESNLEFSGEITEIEEGVAGRKLEDVIKRFHEYCNPRTSIVLNRFQFHNSSQSEDTIDVYLMKLRRLAEGCEFGNQRDSMIRDKLLFEIIDSNEREKVNERS